MFKNLIQNILIENKDTIRKIASASQKTSYLQNAIPLYDFAVEQMAFFSERLSRNPLMVKIPLAAKYVESFIKVKDSEVSRQLLIFEYADILKKTTSILKGRFGVNVNTYQITKLLPDKNIIQDKIERIKEFYDNKSPLAVIKRSDLSSI